MLAEDFHKEEELMVNFKLFMLLQSNPSSMASETLTKSPACLPALEINLEEKQQNWLEFPGCVGI